MNPYSRMDLLRAQALAMRVGGATNQVNQFGTPPLQLQNQPVQSMLKPKYTSNMGRGAVRGYSNGFGY